MMTRFARRAPVLALVVLALLAATAGPSRADEFVDRANRAYLSIAPSKRSDLILLPALAALEPPPAGVSTLVGAMLLPAGASDWAAAEAWATAPTQVAALAALNEATTRTAGEQTMAFGQPYGPSGFPLDLIAAGLYTELGDPPTLAAADFKFLPSMDNLACLVNVEATRLAASGDYEGALGLLADLVAFGRQMADRAFQREVEWGLQTMIFGIRRMRDVLYTDYRATTRKMTVEGIRTMIGRLDARADVLRIERISFPEGDRIAAEQIIARVMTERGGPNDRFAETMARVGSSGRPLRLFSEVARWEAAKETQRNRPDTEAAVKNVYDDWVTRWKLPPLNPTLALPTSWSRLSPRRDALVLAVFPRDAGYLFEDRRMLQAEVVGTRTSLGLLGYIYQHRAFPPTVFATRGPDTLREIDADPYNPRRDRGAQPPMEYFVPKKINPRPVGPREEPRPHTVNVVVLDGRNFAIDIDEDQFILYSVGPDGANSGADRVREDARTRFDGDYLIWPPTISLYRQRLRELGELR